MRPGTVTQLAAERGVSRARVYQWLEAKRCVRLEDGRIDLDDANARLNANLDQAKGIRRDGNITSSSPNMNNPVSQHHAAGAGAAMSAAPAAGADLLGGADSDAQRTGERAEGAAAAKSRVPGPDADVARDETGYWQHKTREALANARIKEMQALREAGALTSSAGVKREAIATARQVRNAMLAIADRIAPVLDPANPTRAHKLLTDEITKALRELSTQLEQRSAALAGADEPELALL